MATTIKETSLAVSISETITINGVQYGNNITKSFEGNGKVDQRVMEITSTRQDTVFQYGAALPDTAGEGVKTEFTYFRITNTDDTIGVTVQYKLTAATESFFVYIPAGCSHFLMSNDADVTCSGEAGATLQDVATVLATCDAPEGEGSNIPYIEYVAVFKGGVGEGE
jgi:hypothetical protein